MSWIKRIAWLLLWLGIAAGATAEIVRGDESNVKPQADVILLDFYSDWCGPCRAMAPAVENLRQTGFAVERINIDDRPELARQYGVTSIPCFVVVHQGREIDRIRGVTTIERLKQMLDGGWRMAEVQDPQSAIHHPKYEPHPAWRYERPVGHRAAVVRIFCQDDVRTRSIGSGALVRWGKRVVVLTARHVVQDAKKIIVELHTKRTHWARVLKLDAAWDCAVLELTGQPTGVEPAEVELGPQAMFGDGDRLESCGYGADGKLAANSGLFQGYRRSTAKPNGPDDWMVISGRARQGDSGGPVFNEKGRVVGVLWGTDGQEVVCVQAGRLHVLLDAAAAVYREEASGNEPGRLVPVVFPQQRHPTPPKCDPAGGCCPAPAGVPLAVPVPPATEPFVDTAKAGKTPLLPWRGDTQKRDDSQDARIEALIELQERERASGAARVEVGVVPKAERGPAEEEPSPLVAGLCILGAVVAGFAVYFGAQKN